MGGLYIIRWDDGVDSPSTGAGQLMASAALRHGSTTGTNHQSQLFRHDGGLAMQRL
jgi:hypothetical protein